MIEWLSSELDARAIRPRALAGEGTHFDIVSSVGSKTIEVYGGLGGSDEKLRRTPGTVDVFVLKGVFDNDAIALCQWHGLPGDLNGSCGGTFSHDALWETRGRVLGGCDLFNCFLAKPHLVASRESENIRCSLVNFFSGVVVLPLGELNNRQRLDIFASKAEPVALEWPVCIWGRVPLE